MGAYELGRLFVIISHRLIAINWPLHLPLSPNWGKNLAGIIPVVIHNYEDFLKICTNLEKGGKCAI